MRGIDRLECELTSPCPERRIEASLMKRDNRRRVYHGGRQYVDIASFIPHRFEAPVWNLESRAARSHQLRTAMSEVAPEADCMPPILGDQPPYGVIERLRVFVGRRVSGIRYHGLLC